MDGQGARITSAALDNTLLATSANTVRAIRRGREWLDVKELFLLQNPDGSEETYVHTIPRT
jgi:hypothetical protein